MHKRNLISRITVLFLVVLAIVLSSALLCACGQKIEPEPSSEPPSDVLLTEDSWGDYFQACGQKTIEWAQNFSVEDVKSLELSWYMEGGLVPHKYADAQMIIATFNSLAVLALDKQTNVYTDDNSYSIRFVMEDGSEMNFGFNDGNAELSGHEIYTLKNTKGLSHIFALARDADTADWPER